MRLQAHRPLTLTTLFLLLAGFALRLGFLDWQPLWADEGYSIYFATEPVTRIFWLTANDIHPPLYYLLLHSCLWWMPPSPVMARLFSVMLATPALGLGVALAHTVFGGRQRPQLIFLLLLLANPLYLYYSQEIRMYGLALSLSMAATLCIWRWVEGINANKPARGWLLGYVISATLALYTLYYLAFLLLAHLLWVSWTLRRQRQPLLRFGLAEGVIALLYLPWIIYTGRILITYVNDKIRSDQDVALGIWPYLTRHLLAFTTGHLPVPAPLSLLALLVVLGLLLWSLWTLRTEPALGRKPTGQAALWLFFAVPLVIGFLVNRFYPFFPTGGERLLLFTLPYLLLLLAGALADLWQPWAIGRGALLVLLATAFTGVGVFYTLPRYQSDDYRPLIRQMVQQGTDNDTILATFPWQVGFWRAYAPQYGLTPAAGPHLQLVSDRSVTWGAPVAQVIDTALAQGTLWLPTLRSIGSTLPAAMDDYLTGRAVNFVQHWGSPTTRLDAWHLPNAIVITPLAIDWGEVQLVGAGVSTTTLPAANFPLMIALEWQSEGALPAVGVTLRLQKDGHTWASRDYQPLGSLATRQRENLFHEEVGFIIPAGLPPGAYELVLGLVDGKEELYRPLNPPLPDARLVPLTTVTITAPATPLPPFRLPIQHPLPQPLAPQVADGVALLGYSGDQQVLAGAALALTLFWQRQGTALAERQIYLSLLDEHGAGVAGWEGWPLPTYPLTQWAPGALVQTPVEVVMPPTVPSGMYRIIAGLRDPISGVKRAPVILGQVAVQQRNASFSPVAPPTALAAPAQFGTHVQLLGYGLEPQADQLYLTLYWQVLQPLWPPHHIFVHLDQVDGGTVTQADAAPQTADGPAPTGSWQPGEYLVTQHRLSLVTAGDASLLLRVGLYLPATEVRLPLSVAGEPAGDAFAIQLPNR